MASSYILIASNPTHDPSEILFLYLLINAEKGKCAAVTDYSAFGIIVLLLVLIN